ncbi:MAG: hypothetical protein L3J49_15195, partial [Desulfobulbaceae bacterium]|nr:hypothetical protein [Desulfobulbaceae bacterium]
MHQSGLTTRSSLLCAELFFFFQLPCFAEIQSGAAIGAADSANSELGNPLHLTSEEQQFLAGKKRITMCVDPAWMPLEKIENGRLVGMTAEYMDLFADRIGKPIV